MIQKQILNGYSSCLVHGSVSQLGCKVLRKPRKTNLVQKTDAAIPEQEPKEKPHTIFSEPHLLKLHSLQLSRNTSIISDKMGVISCATRSWSY
jgi:hypothetical protein